MNQAEETMLELKEFLDKIELPFLLTASTLLGIYRDKTTLGRVEFSFLIKDFTPKKQKKLFKNGKFKKRASENPLFTIIDYHGKELIEIQPIYQIGDICYKNLSEDDCLVWPSYLYENWKKIEFIGVEWNMPSDPEKWLEIYYNDWKTPRDKVDWQKAPNYKMLDEIKHYGKYGELMA